MKNSMRLLFVALVATSLAACETPLPIDPEPQTLELKVQTDNYCRIARKRTWSVADTRETIEDARRENHKIDCLCTELRGTPQCQAYQEIAARSS